MKLRTIIIILILTIASSLFAQAPDTLWTKTYGGPGGARAMSIVPAPGGGYYVGGTIILDSVPDSSGWEDADIWVLRLDEEGDTLWTRSYGDTDWTEYIAQLIATDDGGYALAGNRERYQTDDQQYVMKADVDGNIQWEATYLPPSGYSWIAGLDQTIYGDFILAYNSFGNGRDFGIKRLFGGWGDDLEGAGDESFHILYPWVLDDVAGSVTATSSGGFVVSGWTNSESIITEELFLMKVGRFGIVEWTKTFDSPDAGGPRTVRQTRDGGFVVVGRASRPINSEVDGLYLLKTDAEGNKLWSRSFGGSGGLDVIELPDGSLLATAWDGFTIRVSDSGEMIWSETYGPDLIAFFSAAQAPNGGYVLAGTEFPIDSNVDHPLIYLVKLADDRTPTDVNNNTPDLLPQRVMLAQNYPNPFNPNTTIAFELPQPAHVKIELFNILGRKIRTLVDGSQSTGSHRIEWNGTDDADKMVATGIYLYRLEAGNIVQTRKMMLLK